MNKRFLGKFMLILGVAMATCAIFTSCDEDFEEGFREGWNSTTPSEWHYVASPDSLNYEKN